MRPPVLGLIFFFGFAAAQTCAGLPQLNVTTPAGFCVGVAAQDLRFPRGVLPMPNGEIWVAEMRTWNPNRGSLMRLRKQGGRYVGQRMMEGLDRPNGIALGPDGKIYVGEVGRIFRFDPDRPQNREYVIRDLPGQGRHPLTQMVFLPDGNLLVNVGSASDNCEADKGKPTCAEARTNGLVRLYRFGNGNPTGWTVFARGLRNSMALAVHGSGTVLQGENSRDAINAADPRLSDEQFPADELNVLRRGADYGWPYCYNDGRPAPEFPRHNCAQTQNPAVLLPAHVAPLGMTYLWGNAELGRDWLVVGYHGYRAAGQRLIGFQVDPQGLPTGNKIELIKNWRLPGDKLGAPVDVKQGPDGKIYITDDRNSMLLVFSKR